MDYSLDDYIRESKSGSSTNTNMSLDEYIHMKNIKTSAHSYNHNQQSGQTESGVSKFDRYKYQDEEDDMDDDGSAKEMPNLVPFVVKTLPPKKSIHQRLGLPRSGSICESIHTSQMKLFRPNKFKVKNSVQNRLGKGYVNPAVRERGRIALHHLQTFAKKNDADGQILLNAIKKAIKNETERELVPAQKYDMNIQKEISYLQGKELYYACPGVSQGDAFVISSDGPGLHGMVKVPSHKTDISLNQRFA